mmetsp:Transcript_42853/g.132394  ORF Transcript_42853/g.132394 Transcript_42853/m.132394 type:complete len:292 (-) Transcript_42853:649-1524(-)
MSLVGAVLLRLAHPDPGARVERGVEERVDAFGVDEPLGADVRDEGLAVELELAVDNLRVAIRGGHRRIALQIAQEEQRVVRAAPQVPAALVLFVGGGAAHRTLENRAHRAAARHADELADIVSSADAVDKHGRPDGTHRGDRRGDGEGGGAAAELHVGNHALVRVRDDNASAGGNRSCAGFGTVGVDAGDGRVVASWRRARPRRGGHRHAGAFGGHGLAKVLLLGSWHGRMAGERGLVRRSRAGGCCVGAVDRGERGGVQRGPRDERGGVRRRRCGRGTEGGRERRDDVGM